eukprot:TRINITY_DN13194_c0_g1_i1.p1 TRINITY_DN13194_c0_g1~~TRINITY_DN13194_c0_g1_i1.p1  ORF type:complete len:526 (-),score=82.80 TRINITY_DN13194_c0_g1_i1:693-2231(-)
MASSDEFRERFEAFAKGVLREELELMKASLIEELHLKFRIRSASKGQPRSASKKSTFRRSSWTSEASKPPALAERFVDPLATHEQESSYCVLPTDGAEMSLGQDPRPVGLRESLVLLDAGEGEGEQAQAPRCSLIEAAVESSIYHDAISLVIFASVVCFTVEVDYMARNWTETLPAVFGYLEALFFVVFVVDIFLRIIHEKASFFFGYFRYYNIFDLTTVGMQAMEFCFGGSDAYVVEVVRALRVLRILRMGRLVHTVPSFRIILVSVMSSFSALLWILLFVALVTLSFGVIVTQLVTDFKLAAGKESVEQHHEELQVFFGTVAQSTYYLYQAASEGIHWGDLAQPLMESCSVYTSLIIVAYTAFITFAVMNIVTAYFVESAIEEGHHNHLGTVSKNLWEHFSTLPSSESGEHGELEIREEHFMSQMDSPAMTDYLSKLGLDAEKARRIKFFRLVDLDDSGAVTQDELMTGCLSLLGTAKAVDLAACFREIRQVGADISAQHQEILNALKVG